MKWYVLSLVIVLSVIVPAIIINFLMCSDSEVVEPVEKSCVSDQDCLLLYDCGPIALQRGVAYTPNAFSPCSHTEWPPYMGSYCSEGGNCGLRLDCDMCDELKERMAHCDSPDYDGGTSRNACDLYFGCEC